MTQPMSSEMFYPVFNTSQLLLTCLFYSIGLVQLGLLIYWFDCSLSLTIISFLIFSAIFMISYFVIRRLAVPGLFENFWSTGSIGGIGMLLGHKLDNGLLLNAEHIHHHGHSMAAVEVLPMLISNMTLMMLIFCVPSCVLCCNHCLSNISLPKKLVLHAGNLVSMLMGMIVAVKSAPWMFLGNVANPVVEHYFMVSQMLLFSAFSYIFIYPNLTRINGSHSPLSGA